MTTYTEYNNKKPYQVEDGDKFILENKTGLILTCCDCGLTHTFDFELIDKPHKVQLTIWNSKRSTGQHRRHFPPKVKKAIEVLKAYKKQREELEDAKL